MSFFENLVKKLKTNCLANRLNNAGKVFKNLHTAKNIAIFYNADDSEIENKIIEFRSFLNDKNIKTQTFAFFTLPKKQDGTEKYTKADFEFSNKDLNWLKCPKEAVTKKITEQFFDITILICKKSFFPLLVAFAETDSGLKVSPYFPDYEIADLSFMLKENFTIDEYLENIKKYLIEIKSAN